MASSGPVSAMLAALLEKSAVVPAQPGKESQARLEAAPGSDGADVGSVDPAIITTIEPSEPSKGEQTGRTSEISAGGAGLQPPRGSAATGGGDADVSTASLHVHAPSTEAVSCAASHADLEGASSEPLAGASPPAVQGLGSKPTTAAAAPANGPSSALGHAIEEDSSSNQSSADDADALPATATDSDSDADSDSASDDGETGDRDTTAAKPVVQALARAASEDCRTDLHPVIFEAMRRAVGKGKKVAVSGCSETCVASVTGALERQVVNVRTVASTPDLLCYVVQANMVRLLHQDTDAKMLLRLHKNPIVDMDAAPAEAYCRAAAGGDAADPKSVGADVGVISVTGNDNLWSVVLVKMHPFKKASEDRPPLLNYVPLLMWQMPLDDLHAGPYFEKTLFCQPDMNNVLVKTRAPENTVWSVKLAPGDADLQFAGKKATAAMHGLLQRRVAFRYAAEERLLDMDVHPSARMVAILEARQLQLRKLPELTPIRTLALGGFTCDEGDGIRMLDHATCAILHWRRRLVRVVHWGPTGAALLQTVQTLAFGGEPHVRTAVFTADHLIVAATGQCILALQYAGNKHRFVRATALPMSDPSRIVSIVERMTRDETAAVGPPSRSSSSSSLATSDSRAPLRKKERNLCEAHVLVQTDASVYFVDCQLDISPARAASASPARSSDVAASSGPSRSASVGASPPRAPLVILKRGEALGGSKPPAEPRAEAAAEASECSVAEPKADEKATEWSAEAVRELLRVELAQQLEKAQQHQLQVTRELMQQMAGRTSHRIGDEMNLLQESLAKQRKRDQAHEVTRLEDVVKVISKHLNNNVSTALAALVEQEVGKALSQKVLHEAVAQAVKAPQFSGKLEAQAVTVVERALDVRKNPALQQQIAAMVLAAAQPAVDAIVSDTIRDKLVPGMQQAVTNLFDQIGAALTDGVRQTVVTQMEQVVAQQAQAAAAFGAQIEELQRQISELQRHVAAAASGSATSAANAQTTTSPTTPQMPQSPAATLENAFFEALGSPDLEPLYRLLERELHNSPETILAAPGQSASVLSQPLLLSLVHQLSTDLPGARGGSGEPNWDRFATQLDWLRTALLALNLGDDTMARPREQVLRVLQARLGACSDYMFQHHAQHALTRKLLLVERLLQSMQRS